MPGHSEAIMSDGSVFTVLDYTFDDHVFVARSRGVVNGAESTFEERIEFPETTGEAGERVPSGALLRLLALATSLSYYKATLADRIDVAFDLLPAELHYFRQLIEHGLGEYAYVNQAPWKLEPEITGRVRDDLSEEASASVVTSGRPVVAVGGGKDSIVTIEALLTEGHSPLLYSVNDRGAIRDSVRTSGCEYVSVSRRIDPALLRLNSEGAPNGHVPVTAINSLIGLVLAELLGGGPVIFSNEASADYGNLTWLGRNINHQWSKSLEHEDLLRGTLAAAGLSPDRYFSLLRGYRELEIARQFATHEKYFDSFTSCNRAYRISAERGSLAWCGECPKCLFVFLILAPYISRSRLVEVFGKDILNETARADLYREILGLGEQKPFECVGEPSEAVDALNLVVAAGQWSDSSLVSELAAGLSMSGMPSAPLRGVDRVPAAFSSARDSVGDA